MKFVLLLSALLLAAPLAAYDGAPPPPKLPEPVQSGQELEPEVTIVETEEGRAYEYRANGHLYMVKIQPKVGKPYYEIDSDGDGELDTRVDDPRQTAVPQWVLFRF
ncbi:MAG: DUF2782 domain-containing protein [Gammaproteobacteria bacterium]|nr:DUF2782 domain-containing protein [Gammaproteobacteria bacterium]